MLRLITSFLAGSLLTASAIAYLFLTTTTHYSSTLLPKSAVLVHFEPLTMARLRGLR